MRVPALARELGVVGLVLTALAAAVYGDHVVHGGFISDAWANLANYEFAPADGFSDTVSYFLDTFPNVAVRPLQAVYLVALFETFGSNTDLWLGWQVATNVIMALALYGLLRRLSFSVFDAAFIAALVLIFPAASSVRFWSATIWAPLSITMVLLGFLLTLSAFDAGENRAKALPLHVAALALFVASLLLYEVTLAIMLASVLLYRLCVPWRTAALRWAVDCAVLIPLVLAVTLSPDGHGETTAGTWQHGREIFRQAWDLLATVVLPLGSASWHTLLLVALVPAVALLVHARLPPAGPARGQLRRWLIAMAAGFVVVALGYAVFAPGTDYYAPTGTGIGDRVNAIPSIGWALIVYSAAMLIGTVAFREIPKARLLSSALAALICGLIGIGWLKTISAYSDFYIQAYAEDIRVLGTMRTALPDVPPNSTIWTFGQPVEIVPGIPVFGNTWDMTRSVQLAYDDPTLSSYVAYPGTVFSCLEDSIVPGGVYAGVPGATSGSRYGSTYFIDTTTGNWEPIRSADQCRRASVSFRRSPALLGQPSPPAPIAYKVVDDG